MLGFLKKDSRVKDRMVVIDVGTQYVKVLDIFVKKGQARLNNYRILNLVKEGRRYIGKEISKNIKKSLLDMGVTNKTALTSISGKMAVVRLVDLPKMSKKELKSSLKYQNDLRLPFDIKDAMCDFQIMPNMGAPEGKMKVLIAALPKKEAQANLEVIRGSGLAPVKLDMDSIALTNAFSWGMPKNEDKAVALVNIGAARTNLAVLHEGVPVLCREINIGGISFTEALVSQKELGFDQAEELKLRGDAEVSSIIMESLRPLAQGLVQSFDFFEGSMGVPITKVYISGGGALIRGITDYLKELTHRNVFIWNSLRSIDIDKVPEAEKDLLMSNSPLLTVALGIALGEGEGALTDDKN